MAIFRPPIFANFVSKNPLIHVRNGVWGDCISNLKSYRVTDYIEMCGKISRFRRCEKRFLCQQSIMTMF